jgi:hypothetical protein
MGIEALLACVALVALAALIALVARPWRVEATLKATTSASAISLAGGLDVAGLSASAAAILGGPGVVAVHLRARELWRRPIAHVSVDSLLAWFDELLSKPAAKESALGRLAGRAKTWLLARTDLADLPELGLRVLLGLRDVSLKGTVTCGFSDPALTGKAAAWLFPIAGVLAPFGLLEIGFDWSGRDRLDGTVEVSFRFVPARVALEGLRFAWHHVHLRGTPALDSSTLPALPATITTR